MPKILIFFEYKLLNSTKYYIVFFYLCNKEFYMNNFI